MSNEKKRKKNKKKKRNTIPKCAIQYHRDEEVQYNVCKHPKEKKNACRKDVYIYIYGAQVFLLKRCNKKEKKERETQS